MSDLSPPWGNSTGGRRGDDVVIHVKAPPHATICTVPTSTGAAKQPIAYLLQAAPDLYSAAREILDRHAQKWDGERCPCEDCEALEHAVWRADGEIP